MKKLLTNREIEVLKLIALEYSMEAIAKTLFISVNTVGTHRCKILAKLDVRNTAGMIRRAFELGILSIKNSAVAA